MRKQNLICTLSRVVLLGCLSVAGRLSAQGPASFEPREYEVDRYPASIVIADFNGDAVLDLATVSASVASLSLLERV